MFLVYTVQLNKHSSHATFNKLMVMLNSGRYGQHTKTLVLVNDKTVQLKDLPDAAPAGNSTPEAAQVACSPRGSAWCQLVSIGASDPVACSLPLRRMVWENTRFNADEHTCQLVSIGVSNPPRLQLVHVQQRQHYGKRQTYSHNQLSCGAKN